MTLYKMDNGMIVSENETTCDLCGSPVKVVGHTTKHYEPLSTTVNPAINDTVNKPLAVMPSFEERAAKAKEICRTLPETVTQIHATEQATRLYDEWLMSRIKPIQFPSDEEIREANAKCELASTINHAEATIAWLKERLK